MSKKTPQRKNSELYKSRMRWMLNRYKEPPIPARIPVYLCDARSWGEDILKYGRASVERLRSEALAALHILRQRFRRECEDAYEAAQIAQSVAGHSCASTVAADHPVVQITWIDAIDVVRERWVTKHGASRGFDRILRDFFDQEGRRILSAGPTSKAAMAAFWEGAPGSGGWNNAARDWGLANSVQDLVDTEMSIEKAIKKVAEESGLKQDAVSRAYYDGYQEVRDNRLLIEIWNNGGARLSEDQ
jgi:hypothetical protein